MINRGDVAQQALPTGSPCSGLPGTSSHTWGHGCRPRAPPLPAGDSVLLCVEAGGERAGWSQVLSPHFPHTHSPFCRNVLDAGAPQPGGGDAKEVTETSGRPGKGPPAPIHTMIAITGTQTLPWLGLPLISTTPWRWCNLNPALFLSKSELLSSSLQNIKESSRSYTK